MNEINVASCNITADNTYCDCWIVLCVVVVFIVAATVVIVTVVAVVVKEETKN